MTDTNLFFPVAVSLTQHSCHHLANHKHTPTSCALVIKYLLTGAMLIKNAREYAVFQFS